MALPFHPLLLLVLLPLLDPGLSPLLSNAAASHHHDLTAAKSAGASESATAAPPPPTLLAGLDLAYQAPPRTAPAVPPLNDRAASTRTTTTLVPPIINRRTSVAPPVQAGATEEGLQRLASVLSSLGYNDMASAVPLLANSAPLATWPGAITVFAAPDIVFQASCPRCSLPYLLLEHIAMGYYTSSDLAAIAAATAMVPSAYIGFCLKIVADRGPFGIDHNIFVDGVEVSYPELYNDGRYVVHGLHGSVHPVSHSSCFDGSGRHLTARSADTSAATSASVGRIAIREAIARLRDEGYGFIALAMRVKFAELERSAKLTVFALDDQAIFFGGGHDYVSIVRCHIVPGHRLTYADPLSLRPGTILPTLAGEGQSLVVTHGASSGAEGLHINGVPVNEIELFTNSRIAVHSVYARFAILDGGFGDTGGVASGKHYAAASSRGKGRVEVTGPSPGPAAGPGHSKIFAPAPAPGLPGSSSGDWIVLAAASPVGLFLAFAFGCRRERWCKEEKKKFLVCDDCVKKPLRDAQWTASCCDLRLCSVCLAEGYLRRHTSVAQNPCRREGNLAPIEGSGLEFMKGYYLSSQVVYRAEQKLKKCWLSKPKEIDDDAEKPADKVVIKTFTRLADVVKRRLPRRQRWVYLDRPSDNEPLLLFKQERIPYRRLFAV